jgi:short-subunit dehydrogenase involved in D-alanine esterification of teichoic acids
MTETILITGNNQGIGLELAHQNNWGQSNYFFRLFLH